MEKKEKKCPKFMRRIPIAGSGTDGQTLRMSKVFLRCFALIVKIVLSDVDPFQWK